MLSEMETLILGSLVEKEMRRGSLSDIFCLCAMLSNMIYGSVLTRFVSFYLFICYVQEGGARQNISNLNEHCTGWKCYSMHYIYICNHVLVSYFSIMC